jgi:hypothetical protein
MCQGYRRGALRATIRSIRDAGGRVRRPARIGVVLAAIALDASGAAAEWTPKLPDWAP